MSTARISLIVWGLCTFAHGCGGGCGDDDDDAAEDAGEPDADSGAGDSCLGDIAWFVDNASGRAEAVGVKEPNAFGLHDMLGNAVEWVEDCYHESFEGAPTDGSAWVEEGCEYRVIRGGCYGSTARGVRLSVRDGVSPAFYGSCAPGVRCVRAPGGGPGPGDAGPDAGGDAAPVPVALRWVEIPAGEYEMGCAAGDDGCFDNERPRHVVAVAAFEINPTEVTQQEFHEQTGESPATYFCPECAETYVTWDMAREFCAAVGGRLPTEAEWEYAARAGATGATSCEDQ